MSEDSDRLPMLANFVHQIVHPLNGVVGTVENILYGVVPAHKVDQRLNQVRSQLYYTINMLRNLAYFTGYGDSSASESRRLSKVCVLPQIVIEAINFFQEAGNAKGIKLELLDRRTQYRLHGAPELLRQVFMNLMDNAVKYSDPESRVTVEPWVQRKTGDLLVEVRSTGAGFDASEKLKMFDIGFRGRQAQNTVASGTGLGLYICKSIVEAHGGSIEVDYSHAAREFTTRMRFREWIGIDED